MNLGNWNQPTLWKNINLKSVIISLLQDITERVGKNAKIKPQDFEMFFTIFIFIQRRPTKTSRVLILRQKTTKNTTKQESKINKLVFLQSDAAISKQNVVNPLSKLIMYCYLRHKAL